MADVDLPQPQKKLLIDSLRLLATRLEAGSTVMSEKALIKDTAVALLDGLKVGTMIKGMVVKALGG